MPRLTFIRRARSAREMGWCSRIRLRAIRRLISREGLRVATRKSPVLIFRIRLGLLSEVRTISPCRAGCQGLFLADVLRGMRTILGEDPKPRPAFWLHMKRARPIPALQ